MHGIIHKSLKEYVEDRMSDGAWDALLDEAGIEPKLYLPVSHYPDEEVTAIVTTIADNAGRSERAVQRDFGEFLAPELLDTFKAHVKDDWDTLDVLARLEAIYEGIEQSSDDTSPPAVETARDGDTVTVVYRSDRELCAMAEGIVHGVAADRGESVSVDQPVCVHEGDDHCELVVTRA
ncbi:heme NO-binding domain-containing protein [Halostella litorea]|uniref:heme NO-binding domain-containing protein n=1 Tax=Halostella litorea TaxID=2528831 RepID=UPI00109260AB|nr:heme NO-binding domain-containing protein [Halostella litorea]